MFVGTHYLLMPRSKDLDERIKDNYVVYHFEQKDSDRYLLEDIDNAHKNLLNLYLKLNHRTSIYLKKTHPLLEIKDHVHNKSILDSGSIVEFTNVRVLDDGSIKRPRELFYVERRNDEISATGYFEETLRYTTDIDFANYVRLDCLRIGNKSVLKLTGRGMEEAEKEHQNKA